MTIHEQAKAQHEAHKTARAATYDTPTARAKRHERAAALFNPTGTPRARAAWHLANATQCAQALASQPQTDDLRGRRACLLDVAAEYLCVARDARTAAT